MRTASTSFTAKSLIGFQHLCPRPSPFSSLCFPSPFPLSVFFIFLFYLPPHLRPALLLLVQPQCAWSQHWLLGHDGDCCFFVALDVDNCAMPLLNRVVPPLQASHQRRASRGSCSWDFLVARIGFLSWSCFLERERMCWMYCLVLRLFTGTFIQHSYREHLGICVTRKIWT